MFNFCVFLEGYTRSGPTYDQQSLRSMDDDEYDRHTPAQAAAASAWQLPPQSTQPSQPPSGFSMGRGRGRGRGVQSSQPLRRPNLPGMAAGAAATSQGEIYLFYLLFISYIHKIYDLRQKSLGHVS